MTSINNKVDADSAEAPGEGVGCGALVRRSPIFNHRKPMNSKEQLIAIAEALGWAVVADYGKGSLYGYAKGTTSYDGNDVPPRRVPDYLNDLNAMHEAEKMMGYDERLNYPAQLFDVVCRTSGEWQKAFNRIHPDAWALQATAAQRAEAFLKTLGKWSA